MPNLLDYQRLSTLVSGIVDPKLMAIASSITGSTGYLKGLVTQSQTYSTESLQHANESRDSATEADTAAASTLIAWNEFTSTYLGVALVDPTRSSQGNTINVGAFYIRKADGRLRYASEIAGNGNPVWIDATVTADPASIASAGAGVFLSLNALPSQTVKSPVTFQNTVLTPKVTSWTSQQVATAVDVNDRINTVQALITAETVRATAAETANTTNKVAKAGDTMTSQLAIQAAGELASVVLNNTTAVTGRNFRISSSATGQLRFIDTTANTERFRINPDGSVIFSHALYATAVIAADIVANRTDNLDPGFNLQSSGVTRWAMRRSPTSSQFYIARYNASGTWIDAPISISETDGTVSLNKTNINSTLTTNGNIIVNTVAATLRLNNTSGNNDTHVQFAHLNYSRWIIGRATTSGVFFINRYTDTGVWVETPFSINETNGWVTINNLSVPTALIAAGYVSTPVVYTAANGTGRNISVGDDAWIGDGNVSNGISIRGQSNFNAGFIQFGNSGISLGCNPNDGALRYGGQTVYHTGNLSPFGGFGAGKNANGYWTRQPSIDGPVVIRQRSRRSTGWAQYGGTEFFETVYFPVPYTDLDSVIVNATPHGASGVGGYDRDWWCQILSIHLDRFVIYHQRSSGTADWFYGYEWTAEGYGA